MQTSALSCCHLFFIMPELTLGHNETSTSTAWFAREFEVKLTKPELAWFCTIRWLIRWAHTSSHAPFLDTCNHASLQRLKLCRSAEHATSAAQQDRRARHKNLGKSNVQSLSPLRSGVEQLGSTRKGPCRIHAKS